MECSVLERIDEWIIYKGDTKKVLAILDRNFREDGIRREIQLILIMAVIHNIDIKCSKCFTFYILLESLVCVTLKDLKQKIYLYRIYIYFLSYCSEREFKKFFIWKGKCSRNPKYTSTYKEKFRKKKFFWDRYIYILIIGPNNDYERDILFIFHCKKIFHIF